MGKYYEFTTDRFEDFGVKGYASPKIDISFSKGIPIVEPVPLLYFTVDFPVGYKLPQLLGDAIPIIGNRLALALREAGADNFETFPVILHNPDTGEKWEDFLAFNVLGNISAADLEKSDYDILMQGSDSIPALLVFREIVLKKAKIPNLLMFLLPESSTIIVHEKIVNYLADSSNKDWGIEVIKLDVVD